MCSNPLLYGKWHLMTKLNGSRVATCPSDVNELEKGRREDANLYLHLHPNRWPSLDCDDCTGAKDNEA